MSATGQGGVTVIAGRNHGSLNPVLLPSGSYLTFQHNINRRAFSVIVTSGNPARYGQVLTGADGFAVSQLTPNAIVVSNNSEGNEEIFISCRWEEPTPELDLVQYQTQGMQNNPRVTIETNQDGPGPQ